MTKRALYNGEDVEFIRYANRHDPGFDPKHPEAFQGLIRDAEGKKVVLIKDLMVALGEEPGPTTIQQGPPPSKEEKKGLKRRKEAE